MKALLRSLLLPAWALLASCAAFHQPDEPETPYVLVLGTAQDGGAPQLGSEASPGAWRDLATRRFAASIVIVDPRANKRWLVDATPDIREQMDLLRGRPLGRPVPAGRAPLFDGIFLTHAHMGHYGGLLHFGREAYAAAGQPVWASGKMTSFLQTNAPWDGLVNQKHVQLETFEADRPVALGEGLTITAIPVPHRGEYSDTFAFAIHGPNRSLFYCPDIDKWERWERSIEQHVRYMDIALIDGTFFGPGEVGDRDMSEIPHPFISKSLERFAALPPAERVKIRFTHLNHTNPVAQEGSPEHRAVLDAGCGVAKRNQIFKL